jgi:CRP/FNR family transcriptional regulator
VQGNRFEDSEVCELPFDQLQPLLAEIPTLLRNFHRLMSQEILREQRLIKLLGTMKANQRFAAFLVNQSSASGTKRVFGYRFYAPNVTRRYR